MTKKLYGASVSISLCCLVAVRVWAAELQHADLLLTNGKVITVDSKFSIATTVAVRDGHIVEVGGDEVAAKFETARKLDVGGRAVLPGFNDTHIHVNAMPHRAIDLESARSIVQIQDRLRAKAKQLGPGQWITGYGWDEALLAEHRNPSRADLDAAAPDNPVVLVRAGAHSSVGNSAALRIAKITRATADPARGLIEHDAKGEPNGIVRERNDLFEAHVPPDSWDSLRDSYISAFKSLFALGITSVHTMGTLDDEPVGMGGDGKPGSGLTYRRVRELSEATTIPRVTLYISYPGAARLQSFPHHSGFGDERVRLGAIGENAVDGGFTGPTAWTLVDYKGLPGFRGKGRYTDQELQDMVDTCARLGWQMGLHAIGDAAIVQTVNAYSRAIRTLLPKDTDHRWFLDHFTVMPPDATMQRMSEDGILIAQQPNFLWNLEGRYVATLDDWRLRHNNSVGTPQKRFGLFVAFGSDNLPIGPMTGLQAAVTRRGPSGVIHGPEESVSVPEAIRMYTASGAFLSREEQIKGTLEAGKLADMIVLDADPLSIAAADLMKAQVDLTILGGNVVYERKDP